MIQVIREHITVKRDGMILIPTTALPEGTHAEVVITATPDPASLPPLSSYLGKGKGVFKSAKEVDEFISSERDAWED